MPKIFTRLDGRQWDHYDDSNFQELTGTLAPGDTHPHVVVGGEKRFLAAIKPTIIKHGKAMSFAASGLKLYAESDFAKIIKDRNDAGAWPMNYCDFPCKDQNGHSSCWGSALTQAMQAKARIQGLPGDEVSTCSITGPITGYRDVGGNGQDSLEYAEEHGGVSAKLWPNNSYSSSYFGTTQGDRVHYKVTKRVTITNWREYFSAIAQGHPTTNDLSWWSHVIGGYGFADPETGIIRNSWSDDWGNQMSFPNGKTYGGFSTLSRNKCIDLGEGNTYAIMEVTAYVGPA